MIKSRTSKVTTTREILSEHLPIASKRHKGLVAYKVVVVVDTSTVRNGRITKLDSTEVTHQGVCKKSQLDAFLSGKAPEIPSSASVPRGKWTSHVIAARPAYLEKARRSGWSHVEDEDYTSMVELDPIAATKAGSDFAYIEVHGCAHQIFDIDGLPTPVALKFDYINGRMDNTCYDLEKAVAILMARDDVTLLPGGGERYWKDLGKKNPRNYVGDIPYYNADGDRCRCISFTWHPTLGDYQSVWAMAHDPEMEDRWHSGDLRRACFNLDLFGLRAGGAALHDDYDSSGE